MSRIEILRSNIIRASIEATRDMRNITSRGEQVVRAHNAINHRDVLNKHPEIAAYWAEKRLSA